MTDGVVMAAARIVLEPIFEADFLPSSYGFRPRRSAHHALETIRRIVNQGRLWVLDDDIRACFDEIDHYSLLEQIQRRVCDRRMLKLLRGWLRAGVFEGGIVSATGAGTPQGALVRYADDLVVLCASREQAEQARELAAAVLDGFGLRLHPEKTRTVQLARGAHGFDFLGFHHRMRESWKWRGRWYLHRWPSQRAMASIRANVSQRTTARFASMTIEDAISDLNPVLRGWGRYFSACNSAQKFHQIDSYVHERIAQLASHKHGLQGRNWGDRFNYEWYSRLGIYRLTRTVRYRAAYASR